MVEYEDEFGRVRTVRKSEVPREFMAAKEETVEQEYEYVLQLLGAMTYLTPLPVHISSVCFHVFDPFPR